MIKKIIFHKDIHVGGYNKHDPKSVHFATPTTLKRTLVSF